MTRQFRFLFAVLALPLLALGSLGAGKAAVAQTTMQPAALVNDEVISDFDLAMRLRLAMLSLGMEPTTEQANRLRPQVLRTLIDERLQLQEAQRLGISVSENRLNQAVSEIAGNNNMTSEQLLSMLESNGIHREALLSQTRAQLAWIDAVSQRYGGEVSVSEEEVDTLISQLRQQQGTPQLRLGEIFLAVDEPGTEAEVEALGEELMAQLRQGVDFATLAQQFSQAPSAASGGDSGWVDPQRLPEEVAEAVSGLQPGQAAGPIRSAAGYYIVLLQQRSTQGGSGAITLRQLFMPLPGNADQAMVEEAAARAREATQGLSSCQAMSQVGAPFDPGASGDLGRVQLADLPGPLRQAIGALDVGEPSQPAPAGGGLAVFMVCDREEAEIDRNEIRNQLLNQRLDRMAQRRMRDLRRAAFVDVRL